MGGFLPVRFCWGKHENCRFSQIAGEATDDQNTPFQSALGMWAHAESCRFGDATTAGRNAPSRPRPDVDAAKSGCEPARREGGRQFVDAIEIRSLQLRGRWGEEMAWHE